jgi:plasmid stabilization system protein ParE
MKLIFTRPSIDDLDGISDYLIDRSPSGLENVLAALDRCFDQIAEGLVKGRATHREDVREVIETKYGYLIPYFIEGDRAYVLRVYNTRRQGLTAEDIDTGVAARDDDLPG